jgi:hypothetical protein
MINLSDPLLYEHLGVVIDAFERQGMKDKTRTGFMATAQSPLTAMLLMVQNQKKNLEAIIASREAKITSGITEAVNNGIHTVTANASLSKNTDAYSANSSVSVSGSDQFGVNVDPNNNDPTQVGGIPQIPTVDASVGFSVNADADLSVKRFSTDPELDAMLKAKGDSDWLAECIGCDARIRFDWQVKPVNLLGPIDALLKNINASLDLFDKLTNPAPFLKNICDLLDALSGFCMPDITAIIIALKMAITFRLNFALNIRLDWTTLLAPLLLLITQAIMSLLQAIASVLMAPLDCISGVIATVDQMIKAAAGLANAAADMAKNVADTVGATEEGRDQWSKAFDVNGKRVAKSNDPGGVKPLEVESGPFDELKKKAVATGVSANIKKKQTFEEAMKLPAFFDEGLTGIIGPILNEVRQSIQDLLTKVKKGMDSLNALVSGALSIDLSGLGALIFLTDLVKTVMSLISMLMQATNKPKGISWCRYLDEHPELIVGLHVPIFGTVDSFERKTSEAGTSLLLRAGPHEVGEVKTCGTVKSGVNSVLVESWIRELEEG